MSLSLRATCRTLNAPWSLWDAVHEHVQNLRRQWLWSVDMPLQTFELSCRSACCCSWSPSPPASSMLWRIWRGTCPSRSDTRQRTPRGSPSSCPVRSLTGSWALGCVGFSVRVYRVYVSGLRNAIPCWIRGRGLLAAARHPAQCASFSLTGS